MFDETTLKWFREHQNIETTVMRCNICGLFFKPNIGHTCKKERNKNNDKCKRKKEFNNDL